MNIEKTIHQLVAITCDPWLRLTAPEMTLTESITIEGQRGHLLLTAGFPITVVEQRLKPALQHALQQALPEYTIDITFQQRIRAHQTQLPGKGLRGIKNTIAIGSGKGGVGKSTVTVNLAVALARMGARVGILDADIYGPSIPMMLGKTQPVQLQDEHYLPVFAHGVYAMSIGYLTDETNSTLIWRGPMLAKSLLQMLNITEWDALDYLLIDLPPGTGDIQLSLVQKIPLAGAIVVTTPQQVATCDANKALHLFEKTNIPILGIVENMAMHECTECGHQSPLFGVGGAEALCKQHACEYLGKLPLDAHISQDSDQGTPTALRTNSPLSEQWATIAINASRALARRPLNYADKFPPVVMAT